MTGAPLPLASTPPQVLIRGVESFQVLFGEYVPPPAVGAACQQTLDDVAPQSIVYRTGLGGGNPVATAIAPNPPCTKTATTNWGNVRAVRIAMLLRSATGARTDPDPTTTYQLFGANYPAGADPGVNFDMTTLSALEKTRVRRIVQTTVFVRNRESSGRRPVQLLMRVAMAIPSFSPRAPAIHTRQGGFSLIVSLMMLIVIIILGISGSQMAINEERGSRADRDRQIAFQAAEAALKDAEFEIYGSPATRSARCRTRSTTATCGPAPPPASTR